MKKYYSQELGKLIYALRKERQLSQKQLGEFAGVTYNYIGNLEHGKSDPTLGVLLGIAQGLGLSFSEFAKKIEEILIAKNN